MNGRYETSPANGEKVRPVNCNGALGVSKSLSRQSIITPTNRTNRGTCFQREMIQVSEADFDAILGLMKRKVV